MVEDRLRYDRLVERALRNVVRETLMFTAEHGLPGDHHFYLTFATGYPGVEVPAYLRRQYPNEMTIVIQYQFYGLEVGDKAFSVTLSFNNNQERLTVPFGAITTFADPSVNFALQFQTVPAQDLAAADSTLTGESGAEESGEPLPPGAPGEDTGGAAGKVITLDSFRKK